MSSTAERVLALLADQRNLLRTISSHTVDMMKQTVITRRHLEEELVYQFWDIQRCTNPDGEKSPSVRAMQAWCDAHNLARRQAGIAVVVGTNIVLVG